MKWIDAFRWGTPRESFVESERGRFFSDPNTDTLGLSEYLYGQPSFLMLHFIRPEGVPVLSRLTVSFDGASSDDERLERLFVNIRDDVAARHSAPTCVEGFVQMNPKEFRHSIRLTWESIESLITLSMRLTRDGFPRQQTDVFFFAGDTERDPLVRISWGCVA